MSSQQTPGSWSFNGGELSPLMLARVDTAIYAIGVERMENFVPCIEGPMQKCPGFRRVRAAAASSSWLAAFVFNNTQSYVLECLDQAIRFYTNDARIEPGGAPYAVAVPYSAGEWPRVSMQQSYDRMYMAHGAHAPGALSRTGATTFEYAPLDLKNGPFQDGNSDEAATVRVTGNLIAGGVVTITATQPIFQAGHVGGLFQVEAKDFSDIPAWEVGVDGIEAGSSKRRSDGKVYQAASSGRTGSIQPVHEEGTEWDGSQTGKDINDHGPYGVQWTYLHDRFGIIKITAVTNATTATGTVVRRVPSSLSSEASWRWSHGAFSQAEGWPDLVFIWNGRLCFWKRFELFASVVGDYLNFKQYTASGDLAEDMAFRLTLAAADPPLWVMVDRQLLIGTASGEWAIGAINSAQAVSAVNIQAQRQSGYGSEPVWPVQPGASVIYMERSGRQFREAGYDFGSDRYLSANINRWARHITGFSGIVQLGHQAQTEELLFAVGADGRLVLRSYDPEQEVKGFARRLLADGGSILSAVAVPSPDGRRDDIWALCQWGDVKSVQKMGDWWKPGETAIEDAFFVDDGLSDSLAVASDRITGLEHLAGVEVSILADGGVCPVQTVPSDGVITIPYPAKKRVVGRGYTARMTSLRPDPRDPTGQTAQGKRKRLVNLILRLIDTSGIKARGGKRFETLLDRPARAKMDAPPPLFTGDTPGHSLGGDWERAGQWEIISDDPRPCFVAAGMPRFEVSVQ